MKFKEVTITDKPKKTIGLFEKYLTIWVALGIAAGIGHLAYDLPDDAPDRFYQHQTSG